MSATREEVAAVRALCEREALLGEAYLRALDIHLRALERAGRAPRWGEAA